MKYYIGLDLGTSSLKGILANAAGSILRTCSADYNVLYPAKGWTEQNCADWLTALEKILPPLIDGYASEIVGLSVAGQMHGLVALDEQGAVIRPCILWNDGRTEAETAYLNETVGREELSLRTGNIAFAGFTAPKLLWLRKHEPENFARIAMILLPKDYIVYYLTGQFSTDYSDASGTLLLDVAHKCWSREMCRVCGIRIDQLPPLYESYQPVGTIRPEIARRFGFNPDAVVAAGAGDNAAAAVGTNTLTHGSCNISLGTSGTIFIAQSAFSVDPNNALHSFVHANGGWHLMGCTLSAASCRSWWLESILKTGDYAEDERGVTTVSSDPDLYFLPYLNGERSPHNDVRAKGAFIGLTATTTREQMSRAIMEGVAFSLRDCMEIARSNGVNPTSTNLCGGGAKSAEWRRIFANVLGLDVHILTTEQGPSFGAVLLAMVASGLYPSCEAAAGQLTSVRETIRPDPTEAALLSEKYRTYRQLYPLLKTLRK
ncbi:MAG: xylulokinase [Eubacteriales bacterium]|nr:xylulokinase [Eubacteriales bacterium]